MIGQTISHYRILGQLGEGGMGVVWEAEDTRLGRRVAIKIPSAAPDNQQHYARFLREARSVSALNHRHIATLFDYGEMPDGRPFIVMELINGRELGDLMHNGELTLARSVEIIRDVAEALCEAHRHSIIHRDIKPSNIIINERGEVKVLDFGLAKLIGDESATNPDNATLIGMKTRSDVMLGTPLYLSPEQAKAMPVDARSDLFALGALLYECIAGRPAFSGATVVEIAAQVIHVNPPSPSQYNRFVPAELDRITLKLLAKQPAARYQTAEELIADLHALCFYLSEMDETRTPSLNLRASGLLRRSNNLRTSSLTTLSDNLRRPRLSIAAVLGVVAILLAGVWGVRALLRPRLHVPSPDVIRAYEAGTDLLREGAYYQASKRLQRATSLDDKFVLAHARLAEAWTELDYSDRAKDAMLQVSALDAENAYLSQVDALYLEAIRATVSRKFTQAVEKYREIARLLPERSEVYVDLGRAYEKTEEIKPAIENYVEATNRDPNQATAYLRIGILYGRQQNLASANAAFDKAEQIYKGVDNREGQTEALYQRGYLYRKIGKLAESRETLEQALALAKTNGRGSQLINTLLQLSAVAFGENDAPHAQAYAREAVELAQTDGMENLVALGYVDLGNTYFAQSNYAEAEKYLKQGLEFAQRYNLRRYEAKALINLGSLRIQQGATDEGARDVQQALDFFRSGGYSKETTNALILLGRVSRQKGNYADALKSFEQLLQLAEQQPDPSLIALSHTETGNVLLRQNKYAEALKHFEEGYRVEKSLGNEIRMGYALLNHVDALWPLGRADEVSAMLEQVRLIAEKPDSKNKDLLAYLYLAETGIALSERRFAEAQAKSRQALMVSGGENQTLLIEARSAFGLAQVFSGAKAAGVAACNEAFTLANRVGDPWFISNAQLALAEAQLESGNAASALTNAQEAQATFAQAGQQPLEWRAQVVAARAAAQTGNPEAMHEHASRATALLAELRQQWGADVFNIYQARPDVQIGRKQLDEVSGNVR